jgi:hypothetical protein
MKRRLATVIAAVVLAAALAVILVVGGAPATTADDCTTCVSLVTCTSSNVGADCLNESECTCQWCATSSSYKCMPAP